MTTKKTTGRSKALAVPKPQPLATIGMNAIGDVIGPEALRKLPGEGGELVCEGGVVRVTGRDYATRLGTVPDPEIYIAESEKPTGAGPWLGEADKLSWVDPATGLECIMLRNPEGFLSGYVGVPETHPMFWLGSRGRTRRHRHRGAWRPDLFARLPERTQSRAAPHCRVPTHLPCSRRRGAGQACHGPSRACGPVVVRLRLQPPLRRRTRPQGACESGRFMAAETAAEYRDDGYVVREILNLAAQLKAIHDGRPMPAREGPPLPAMGLDPRSVS